MTHCMTGAEVAEVLGIKKNVVYGWLSKGKFPGAQRRKLASGRGGQGGVCWFVPARAVLPVLQELTKKRKAIEGLLNRGEAALVLGISVGTVSKYASEGKIPSVRGLWDEFLFRREDLEEYKRKQLEKERAPWACRRCWIDWPPLVNGLCWLCRYELAHDGKPYTYTVAGGAPAAEFGRILCGWER